MVSKEPGAASGSACGWRIRQTPNDGGDSVRRRGIGANVSGFGNRSELYTAEELLAGFDPGSRRGFVSTWDFQQFIEFKRSGADSPPLLETRLKQASHDAHIAHALMQFLAGAPPLVGVMGGHKLRRDSVAYEQVARLARQITRADLLVATGGGPGAMEAAHFGAACADVDDELFNAALAVLQSVPELPRLGEIVDKDGQVVGSDEDLEKARDWLLAAVNARAMLPSNIGASLAIPTWLYGQEPVMPFATAYAKYFHNSIREEALVTHAKCGIVYAQGGGGTLREIFQDVEQNYYTTNVEYFTPMIFFDPDGYWERDASGDAPGIDLDDALRRTFVRSHGDRAQPFLRKVIFTTDMDRIITELRAQADVSRTTRQRLLIDGAAAVPTASWNR